MKTAAKRPFSAIFDKYKTYDPSKEGYGSVNQWKSAFNTRMGLDEAVVILSNDDPLKILGLYKMPGTLEDLKLAYKRTVLQNQHCWLSTASIQDQDFAKKIIAAFTKLKHKMS
jgi:hypothetical protein